MTNLRNATLRLTSLGVAVLALACADADPGETAPADGETDATGSFAVGAGDVVGQGLLEVLDPEDPERPHFKNYGELPFGVERRWTTRFRNVGDGPLRILSAQAACGCTHLVELRVTPPGATEPTVVRDFRAETLATVPVGGELDLDVQVLTRYSTANQQKLAIFRMGTDSVHEPFTTLEVAFLPTRPFIFAPLEAKLLNTPTSHGGHERIKVLVDRAGNPARVLGIESFPEGLDVELVEESFGGEYVWWVDVRVPPMAPLGVTRGKILLRTTDASGEGEDGRLELQVTAQVVADAVLETPLVALGAVRSSEGKTITTRLTALVPGAKLGVENVRIESSDATGLSARATPVDPDDNGRARIWNVEVSVAPGRPAGFLSGDVVFELDEPIGGARGSADGKELRVRLSGQIAEG